MRAPGRARRPRRAAPTGRHRERPRVRGPPGTSAPTTPRAMSAHARRAPHTHAMRAPGPARRPRRAVAHENAIGDAHGRAGRRGRRPLPCTAPCPPTHATSAHARHVRTRTPCAHLVRRDVPGAPRPRDAIGNAHGDAGRRGRRPLPRSTPHPHGRARRPRRAAPTERPRDAIRDAHGDAGRRGRRPQPCNILHEPRAVPRER